MWPTPQDYNEAIQNPRLCFHDKDLIEASVVLNSLGLPKPVTGAFASVYQMDDVRGRQFAVRCFLHNIPDQAARYAEISAELKRLASPYMVPFDFVNDGIVIQSVAYPILKMQWVNGAALIEWVQRRLDYPDQIAMIAAKFKDMCIALRASGIAHGDLQHGNIIVSDDELKLVDYDAMFVSALAGRDCPEIGHRHYQHPHRTGKNYDEDTDNFSQWSIYTSLLCLSLDPILWRSLGAGDECLLFRQEDYMAPRHSVAFRLLENHESLEIQRAAQALRRVCALKMAAVPPLGTRVDEQAEERESQIVIEPLPAELTAAGRGFRNLREAPQVKLVVDEEQAVPISLSSMAHYGVPRRTSVPVQVLPRSQPQKPINWGILLVGSAIVLPILISCFSLVGNTGETYTLATNTEVKLSTEDEWRKTALAYLHAGDARGLAMYREYMSLVQANMSQDDPQQTALTDLLQAAAGAYSPHDPNFDIRIRELAFDLIKTVHGPRGMTPREQSNSLYLLLRECSNDSFARHRYPEQQVFQKAAEQALQTIKTNPMAPIEWPAEYRTNPGLSRHRI